jgi:hypothetical protein
LIADRVADAIIVGQELRDEFVQARLENIFHSSIFELAGHAARKPLCLTLPPVKLRKIVEIAVDILVAARKGARHLPV